MNLYYSKYCAAVCDECVALDVPLVEVRKEQDDDGAWLTTRLCEKCLREALALVTTEEEA